MIKTESQQISEQILIANCHVAISLASGGSKLLYLAGQASGTGSRKRQRTGALQNLAEFVAASKCAKRLGVRQSSGAFGSKSRFSTSKSLFLPLGNAVSRLRIGKS